MMISKQRISSNLKFCLIGWTVWLSYTEKGFTQNVYFSQYHLSPAQTNPASIVTSNQKQVILNYRQQFIEAGSAFETPVISFIYPWIRKKNGKKKAAFGLSILQDKSGDNGLLTTTGGLLTGSLNLNLSPKARGDSSIVYKKYLSLGAQAGIFQRRIDQNSITTGSQWTGSGVDPSLGIGESSEFFNLNSSFTNFNIGAMYYMADDCGDVKAYFGINMQNLNQPDASFLPEASSVPMTLIGTAGYSFYVGPTISIQPNVRWIREDNVNEFRLGSLAYYDLNGPETGFFGRGKAGAGVWYDSNGSIAAGVEVHQPKYFLGFSYDLGASQDINNLGNASWEISLGIKFGRPCKRPPKFPDPIKDTTSYTVQVEGGDSIYVVEATILNDMIESTRIIDSMFVAKPADNLIPTDEDLRVFKKKAFFYYISDEINKSSAALLDKIAATMKQFKGIRIQLNGHTCNIGRDNNGLSIRRGEAVKNYLIDKGIAADRLVVEGFGDQKPILSNNAEFGRIKNRRVEFKVLSTGAESE